MVCKEFGAAHGSTVWRCCQTWGSAVSASPILAVGRSVPGLLSWFGVCQFPGWPQKSVSVSGSAFPGKGTAADAGPCHATSFTTLGFPHRVEIVKARAKLLCCNKAFSVILQNLHCHRQKLLVVVLSLAVSLVLGDLSKQVGWFILPMCYSYGSIALPTLFPKSAAIYALFIALLNELSIACKGSYLLFGRWVSVKFQL